MSHQSYLLVKLELEGERAEIDRSTEYLTTNVNSALKIFFGDTGAAIPFKVIKSCPEDNSVIISCSDTFLVKLRVALTLQSSYQGNNVHIHIKAESYHTFPFLQESIVVILSQELPRILIACLHNILRGSSHGSQQ